MTRRVTPMIHVPSVRDTVDWYRSIGFALLNTGEDSGELVWAELSWGDGRVMFSAGGHPSTARRREVDLYVHTTGVDELFQKLQPGVRMEEAVHDTFYGMREFIIRDNNGFWITFGEPLQEDSRRATIQHRESRSPSE
jgi:uncharacterized glyoxalase superfamily protein PhnB